MSTSTPARRPRSDGVRNRELLVEAAREVFATRGFGATLDDIAKHAGVGVGTAYRHFPNKQAIAAEVLRDATEQIAVDAEIALAVDDPWDALVMFFERVAARQAVDRGLYETLMGRGDDQQQALIWPRIEDAVTQLFARAVAAGRVRADAAAEDIAALFAMLGPVFVMSRALQTDLWRRYLMILLDGFREAGHPPLTTPAPGRDSLQTLLFSNKLER